MNYVLLAYLCTFSDVLNNSSLWFAVRRCVRDIWDNRKDCQEGEKVAFVQHAWTDIKAEAFSQPQIRKSTPDFSGYLKCTLSRLHVSDAVLHVCLNLLVKQLSVTLSAVVRRLFPFLLSGSRTSENSTAKAFQALEESTSFWKINKTAIFENLSIWENCGNVIFRRKLLIVGCLVMKMCLFRAF